MNAQQKRSTRVVVVIVSYRTAELVGRSLVALDRERGAANAEGIEVSCIVVDNASGDAPHLRNVVATHGWDWVQVYESPTNGGFAYGNNRAFELAFADEMPPDYFFLLNPDAEVRPDAIGTLVRFLVANPRAGMAASSLEDVNGEIWPYAFRFPNIVDQAVRPLAVRFLERLFDKHMVAMEMGASPREVDWFPGAAMMCRAEVVRQLGGMDEAYFLYYEETDFCLKARRAGWHNWYVPGSRVMHIAGQSTGVTGESNRGKRLPSYWFDSRRRYFHKNHGLAYAMATDVVGILSLSIGGAQRCLRGKAETRQTVSSLVDFVRGSTLFPQNRALSPALETLKRGGAAGASALPKSD